MIIQKIENKEEYYNIVDYYRYLIDQDPYEEKKPLLELEIGVDF